MTMNPTISIVSLVIAAASFSSCVVSDYPGGPVRGSVSSSFGVYDTLPNSYVGSAYRYQNRYYSGGKYETGNFQYKGRNYDNRYYHGGKYYYGGRNEYHGNNRPQNQFTDDRNDRGDRNDRDDRNDRYDRSNKDRH
jgi:hypothetical protein